MILKFIEDDLIVGDDGYWVYWPTLNKGALTARDLLAIANELDIRNKMVDTHYEQFFN